MVGDEAKFVYDICEYMANRKKAKKRGSVEANTKGNELKEIEIKKLKTKLNNKKIKDGR